MKSGLLLIFNINFIKKIFISKNHYKIMVPKSGQILTWGELSTIRLQVCPFFSNFFVLPFAVSFFLWPARIFWQRHFFPNLLANLLQLHYSPFWDPFDNSLINTNFGHFMRMRIIFPSHREHLMLHCRVSLFVQVLMLRETWPDLSWIRVSSLLISCFLLFFWSWERIKMDLFFVACQFFIRQSIRKESK